MTTPAFFYGTGRRKTAVARVRLVPGSGEIVVNDRTLDAHFGNAIAAIASGSVKTTWKYSTGRRSAWRSSSHCARTSDWHLGQCRLRQLL